MAFAPAASAQEQCAYPFDPASAACGGGDTYLIERDPKLPFTGSNDITLLGIAAGGAVAGGAALLALGRKRRAA